MVASIRKERFFIATGKKPSMNSESLANPASSIVPPSKSTPLTFCGFVSKKHERKIKFERAVGLQNNRFEHIL